jgi:hypothetical protein
MRADWIAKHVDLLRLLYILTQAWPHIARVCLKLPVANWRGRDRTVLTEVAGTGRSVECVLIWSLQ